MPRALFLACLPPVFLFALLQLGFVGLNNDTNMLLHASAHMLDDGGLYHRWITVNSPLFYAIYALPVLASAWLKLPVAMLVHGITVALCILSLIGISRLLKESRIEENEQRLWLLVCSVALLVAPCIFHTFSDREHYLLILALPWLMQMLLRLPPHPLTAAVAALGFCIKPYNPLLFIAMTFFGGPREWSLRQKLLSPSSLVVAGIGALYLVTIFLFFPDYPNILIVAWKTYAAIAVPFHSRLIKVEIFLAVTFLLIAGIKPVLRLPFFGFAAAIALIYLLNAGWIYTGYLLNVPLLLLCPLLMPRGQLGQACAAAIVAATTIIAGYNMERDIRYTSGTGYAYGYAYVPAEIKARLQEAASDNFIYLSVTVWSAGIEALHGPPHSVYAYIDGPWSLGWVNAHPGTKESIAIWKSMMVKPLLEAISTQHYPVVIADESPGQSVNFFALLQKDDEVQRAMKPYVKTGTIESCMHAADTTCRFSIWTVPH